MNKRSQIYQEDSSSDSSPSIGSEAGSWSPDDSESSNYSRSSEESFQRQDLWSEYDIEESKEINSEKPKFDLPSGLAFDSSKFEDPIEIFNLLFDDKFIDDICEYTNLYHRENRTARDRRGSHQKKWKKPDIVEMRAFLGLLLFTDIVKKPNIKDYWSESILFGTPGIAQIFSRDQFLDIRKSLHFVDEKSVISKISFIKFTLLLKR